jgi:hypothetical protein
VIKDIRSSRARNRSLLTAPSIGEAAPSCGDPFSGDFAYPPARRLVGEVAREVSPPHPQDDPDSNVWVLVLRDPGTISQKVELELAHELPNAIHHLVCPEGHGIRHSSLLLSVIDDVFVGAGWEMHFVHTGGLPPPGADEVGVLGTRRNPNERYYCADKSNELGSQKGPPTASALRWLHV